MDGHRDSAYERPLPESLLTTQQVAERLAVSPLTVRRLTRAGQLPRVRIGGSVRYRRGDVDALVDRNLGPALDAAPPS